MVLCASKSKWKAALLLGVLMASCAPMDSSELSSSDEMRSSFQCFSQFETSHSDTLFLSKKQLSNTIEDLFGSQALQAASVSLSTLASENHNEVSFKRQSLISGDKVQAYHNIAKEVSNYVVSDTATRRKVFGVCADAGALTSACLDDFLNGFAVNILRRALKPGEKTFVQNLRVSGGSKDESLVAIMQYLLQSPYFIWRIELGGGVVSGNNFYLTPFETAARLSYKLTDSTPDQNLIEAAKQDQLKTETQIKTHARRLLMSNRGKKKAVENILRWSLTDKVEDLSNLPSGLTAGVQMAGLGTAMIEESKKYIEHIVFDKKGTFKNLLSSKASFAEHPGLASIYEHSPYTGGEPRQFNDVRKGILMRAPFYTSTGSRTSIIHRGVELQERILCNSIPTPNVDIANDRNVNARTQVEALLHSNRSNITELTKSPVCMGCHSVINPTGFALEEMDSLGRESEGMNQFLIVTMSFYTQGL